MSQSWASKVKETIFALMDLKDESIQEVRKVMAENEPNNPLFISDAQGPKAPDQWEVATFPYRYDGTSFDPCLLIRL